MTLQLRLTIALVAVITTVVTVAGIFAVTSAESELVDGVDDFLTVSYTHLTLPTTSRV